MWGYIAALYPVSPPGAVPSLYVRVYHWRRLVDHCRRRSLIICEGISNPSTFYINPKMFPHYMWGYIFDETLKKQPAMVPSLYVRVYRVPLVSSIKYFRSLIICEGISTVIWGKVASIQFPHYMWGYIASRFANSSGVSVPSLYVRVYRNIIRERWTEWGSLIICEGISAFFASGVWIFRFPHYMWGYIVCRRGMDYK